MPIGIFNYTNITMQNLTDMANVSSFTDFSIKVNNGIYGGYLYFVLLCVLWVIMFIGMQKVVNEPLHNAMYAGVVITVLSFFMRAIFIYVNGIPKGLITNSQMWVFPLITLLLAGIAWATKE